jgi:hypothetical protein
MIDISFSLRKWFRSANQAAPGVLPLQVAGGL